MCIIGWIEHPKAKSPLKLLLMFTSFIPWLWAAICATLFSGSPNTSSNPQLPTPSAHSTSNFQPQTSNFKLLTDSVFTDLQTALARRVAENAPEKCYVHTDRTLLAPGDTLWWNAYVRNAGDLMASTQSEILYVELLDARGSTLQQRVVLAIGGTAAGEFPFAASLPGGVYKLRAHTLWMKNTEAVFERDITLQKTVLPRINLRLEWERKAVGPGEVAIARFDASSLDNQPLANRTVRYTASAAGKDFAENTATTDAAGRAYIRFEMPKKLDTPDGLLNIQIEHNSQTEAISRAIPIVLNKIDLQFFAEGGDGVAGLPCHMAFKAVNEYGKAADVEGVVQDSRGQQVATFASWHNGMGAFDFEPQPGEQYTARLTQPASAAEAPRAKAARSYELPELRSQGFALHLEDHTADGLVFQVAATRPGKAYLVGMSGDKMFFFKEVNLGSQLPESPKILKNLVAVSTEDLPMGIARFTLFNEKKVEIAERLVFVNRDHGLHFDIKTDKAQYLPRETVHMSIRATDHAGRPVQGQFSMGVTDESLLTFADDKQGHLLSALLLEQDLRGTVEEPNFYFDKKEAKAVQALDHLMLTQGWRRFEWKEVMQLLPLVYEHSSERATVEGWLCDANTGKLLAGKKLTLHPDGATVETDTAGNFHFVKADITRYRHIRDEQNQLHEIADFPMKMMVRQGIPEGRQQWYYSQSYPSQQGPTILSGKVTDEAGGEELIGASVRITMNGQTVRGTITDFNGDFRIPLNPGKYDVEVSYTGYTVSRVTGVNVLSNKINYQSFALSSGTVLEEVVIKEYKVPLIKQDDTSVGQTMSSDMGMGGLVGGMGLRGSGGRIARSTDAVPGRVKKEKTDPSTQAAKPQPTAAVKDKTMTGQALTSDQIKNLPTRTAQQIVATTAGTTSIDGDKAVIRGSRSNATNYYIDGIRVQGVPPPVQDLENKEFNMGGLGAEYGEPTQGIVSMASRQALSEVIVVDYGRRDVARETGAISTIRFDAPEHRKQRDRRQVVDDDVMAPAAPTVTRQPIRQYTRARQFYVPKYASGPVSQRTDFRPTIYWNPDLRTDLNGLATVEFVTSDAVTNFRTTIEGISSNGIPGRCEEKFFVEKPISVSVKLPHSVISGDTLRLQVVVSNRTDFPVSGQFSVTMPECFKPVSASANAGGATEQSPLILPKTSVMLTRSYCVGVSKNNQNQPLTIAFRSPEAFEDEMEAQIRVLDRGFPARHVLTANQAQNQFNIHLMEPVEGTMSAVLTAYPSPLEDVLKGMERMLRQPGGCFEQVSSSNYPNLLVLDLLRSTGTARPEVENHARTLLESGYKQLTAYECKSGGFDWWGRDPGHEGLTAYGLLEFTDMSRVFEVDKKMIDRAAQWLLSRRDGKGSWKRAADQHGWQADGVLDAYIAWSVAEAGYGQQFKTEIEHAYQQTLNNSDLYQTALLANALGVMKDSRAQALLVQLLEKQEKDGSWIGSSHSIMYAYGNCFRIETTALSVLALMKSGSTSAAVSQGLEFIMKSKNEYGYGSTQSTVLALRALIEYAKIGNQKQSDGQLVVQVDGKRVAEQPFSTQNPKRIEIAGLEAFFTHNDPRVEVFFEGKNGQSAPVIPFDLEIKYASRLPRNTANCPISLKTELGKTTARVGETVRLSTVLKNESKEMVASPMVVLGIPAGLNLQPWQLKKLMDEKHCDFYELWDGYAVFHFEKLAAGESRILNLDLRADIMGTFEAPASQAFLYYQNDQRVWSKPQQLTLTGE